jgi:hypothetical protein
MEAVMKYIMLTFSVFFILLATYQHHNKETLEAVYHLVWAILFYIYYLEGKYEKCLKS